MSSARRPGGVASGGDFGSVTVALQRGFEQLLHAAAVGGNPFPHEKIAVVPLRALTGEGEGNLDHLRRLDRAADVMGAVRGRPGTGAGEALQSELQEAAVLRRTGCGTGADAHDVVPGREVLRDREPLDRRVARSPVARGHGQVGAPVEMGQPQVVLVVEDETRAIAKQVDGRRIHLRRLVEAEGHRARRPGDLPPVVAERVVRRGDLAQLRDQRGVFRERGRVINRLEPLQRPLPVVQGLAIPLQDDGLDLFRLEMELPRDAGDGPGVERILERLLGQRLVDLELVAGEEKVGADGIEARPARIRGQRAHLHLHAEERPQRVAVLAAVEPAERDDAALIPQPLAGRHHRVGQVVQEVRLGLRPGLRLPFRRHVARVQGVEDLLPALRGRQIGQREAQLIHPELPLLLLGPVASQAIVLEEGTVPLGHRGRGRLRRPHQCRTRGDEEGRSAEEDVGQAACHGVRLRLTSPSRP